MGLVWTPKKGLENNLAWKCLAGISHFLNPANLFSDFQVVQNLCSITYSPHALVELERWLADVTLRVKPRAVFQHSNHFWARLLLRSFLAWPEGSGV